jgi:hypothetical protein
MDGFQVLQMFSGLLVGLTFVTNNIVDFCPFLDNRRSTNRTKQRRMDLPVRFSFLPNQSDDVGRFVNEPFARSVSMRLDCLACIDRDVDVDKDLNRACRMLR